MRTKSCIICQKPHTNSMSKCCWPKCQNKYDKQRYENKRDKAKDRINVSIQGVEDDVRELAREDIRKVIEPYLKNKKLTIKVGRGKVRTDYQKLSDKADDLWSIAVKINYWMKCAYSWECDNLNSHHIFTRSRNATRWDIDNGICLTANHHTFSQEFSAHKTPARFKEWLIWVKWERYYNELEKKSQSVFKVTTDFLKEKIKELENFIANNK